MASRKILITGGSGFIGTNLIEYFKTTDSVLLNLDINPPLCSSHNSYWQFQDILEKESLFTRFNEFRPDYVVHLAARTDCDEKTTVEEGYQANVEGVSNVISTIQSCKSISKAIFTSTQYVHYGDHLPTDDMDYAPHTVYGQSKVLGEKLVRKADLQCAWVIVRPTNVWGPWHLRYREQFIKMLRMGLYLHPSGHECIKSYGYVGNLVDQIGRILDAPIEAIHQKTLYLGDSPIQLLDWVNGFSMALNNRKVHLIPGFLLYLLAVIGDIFSFVSRKPFLITTSRFRSMTEDYLTPMENTFKVLGYPRYSLDEGIHHTISWLMSMMLIRSVSIAQLINNTFT
jgi:nucleoside-diphosphate-sugar epimerase